MGQCAGGLAGLLSVSGLLLSLLNSRFIKYFAQSLLPAEPDVVCFMSFDRRFCAFCVQCSLNLSYYHIKFSNICFTVSCINYFKTKCFKIIFKNISTYGEVV